MQNAKGKSANSIKIMQEHNWVVEFLKYKIQKIENRIDQYYQQYQHQQPLTQDAEEGINKFIIDLRNHFVEEEQIVFPLALKASAADSS